MPLSQGDQSSSATTRSDQGAAGLTGKSVFVVWLTLAAGLAVALVLMCMGTGPGRCEAPEESEVWQRLGPRRSERTGTNRPCDSLNVNAAVLVSAEFQT